MKPWLKQGIVTLLALALVAALAWLFIENREGREREEERKRPVAAEAQVSRSPTGERIIALDRAAQQHLGLRDTVLAVSSATPELRAYGQIVDPSSLVALDGDLSATEAASRASQAAFARGDSLYRSEVISQAAYDAAEAQYRSDDAHRRQAEQEMAAKWGDWISTQPSADRHALIERIAERRMAFARVSLPAGESVEPQVQNARIEVFGHERSPLRPQRVLDAPSTDPRTPGPSFLLLFAPTSFSVRPGDPVTAFFPVASSSSIRGVVVPRDASVWYGGKVWAYVRTDPEQFVRREISTDQPTMNGWFTRSGFAVGERLVVVGAQALLSEEFKSQIQIGEDGEEKDREEKGRR